MPKIVGTNLADHRERVREALLDALDSLLDERDYERITMSEIASRAGVARNTIYNYATDKAALLAASVHRSTAGVEATVDGIAAADGRSATERLGAVVRYLLTSFTSGTQRVFVLQAQVGSLEVEDRAIAKASIESVQSRMSDILDDGVRSGEFDGGRDTALRIALISGVMTAAVPRIAQDPLGTARVVDETTSFILRAIRTAG